MNDWPIFDIIVFLTTINDEQSDLSHDSNLQTAKRGAVAMNAKAILAGLAFACAIAAAANNLGANNAAAEPVIEEKSPTRAGQLQNLFVDI